MWLGIESIRAWIEIQAITPDKWVDRQQGPRTQRSLVSGRNVERDHLLPLILVGLVVGIRTLEPITCKEQVQVQYVSRTPIEIESVEDAASVSYVVNWLELWSVEESARSCAVQCRKISSLAATESANRTE